MRGCKRGRQNIPARQGGDPGGPFCKVPAPVLARGEQHLAPEVIAKPMGEDQGCPCTGCEPVPEVVAVVDTFGGMDGMVAIQAERPAGADPMALHGGDDREFAFKRQGVDPPVGEAAAALLQIGQAVPRTTASEVAVVTGQYHHLGIGQLGNLREGLFQAIHERRGKHVAAIALIHGQEHDPVVMELKTNDIGLERNRTRRSPVRRFPGRKLRRIGCSRQIRQKHGQVTAHVPLQEAKRFAWSLCNFPRKSERPIIRLAG